MVVASIALWECKSHVSQQRVRHILGCEHITRGRQEPAGGREGGLDNGQSACNGCDVNDLAVHQTRLLPVGAFCLEVVAGLNGPAWERCVHTSHAC